MGNEPIMIDETNASTYLRSRGWLAGDAQVEVLAGGVSNIVLLVTPTSDPPFVLKQSRPRLRVEADWFSRVERIWREIDFLKLLEKLLSPGQVPRILQEDKQNYLFLMEAIDRNHIVWKEQLLAGQANADIARTLGRILARIHAASFGVVKYREEWWDLTCFEELRLDPFYRELARNFSELLPLVSSLEHEIRNSPTGLVLADFSPKNILIVPDRIVLVDFETAHYGDPAFDLGFFLSHLLLKTIWAGPRWRDYWGLIESFLEEYTMSLLPFSKNWKNLVAHWGLCTWARIDGKSRVHYLNPAQQSALRQFCRKILPDPPANLLEFQERFTPFVTGTL